MPLANSSVISDYSNVWTHLKILNNKQYSRVASNFNPTLKPNGQLVDYDYSSYIKQGILTISQKNQTKYKFVGFNSTITVKNFYFNESGILQYLPDGCQFQMHMAPFKQLKISNCGFNVQDAVVYSVEGVNIHIEHSVIDLAPIQNILTLYRIDDCSYYQTPGIGNSITLNNFTITGHGNSAGSNRIMLMYLPINITFTNSLIVDVKWYSTTYGIIAATSVISCQDVFFSFNLFENNTFVNTQGIFEQHFPIRLYHDYLGSNVFFEVIMRNNKYINQSTGIEGFHNIVKIDQANFKVLYENNYFENILTPANSLQAMI